MLIYNSIIVVMIMSFFSIDKKYFGNLLYFVILMLFAYFPIIVGLNSARPDYAAYIDYFIKLPKFVEPGYIIIAKITKLFTSSVTIFFIIFCLLSFCFRFIFIKYFAYKEDIILVLFAFFAHEFLRKDCVQIRNGIASAIVLFSFIYLYRGQKIKYIFWILIATCFHAVSLIALPLVIFNTTLSKKWLLFLQITLIIFLLFGLFFKIKNILYIFEKLGIIPAKVTNYLYWNEYSRPMPIYHPILLKQIIICFFFLFIKKNMLLYSNVKAIFLFKIYFVSTLYYLFFLDFEIMAGRFGSLFYGVETLFLLQIINSSNIKQKNLWKFGVYLLICIIFIYNILSFSKTLSFEATFQ